MQESGLDLDDLAQMPRADEIDNPLRARIVGQLGRAPDEALGMRVDGGHDAGVRRRIDPEGFFPEQVLSRRQDIGVDVVVQVVRHGAVDGLHVVIGQKGAVVRRDLRNRRDIRGEPVGQRGVQIADRYDLGAGARILQMQPPGGRGGEFAPHEATADDTEPDDPRHGAIRVTAFAAVVPSWTTAISAFVMPAGSG